MVGDGPDLGPRRAGAVPGLWSDERADFTGPR